MVIIGLVGDLCSGKEEMAKYLKKNYKIDIKKMMP